MDLLEGLRREQGGASDAAFARRLGIPRETWAAIKAGRVALGGRVLVRLARAVYHEFPRLFPAALAALVPDAFDGSRDTETDSRRTAGRKAA